MNDLMTWGDCDQSSAQGWAYRGSDPRFWTASFSGTHNTAERDGPMAFDGLAWRSAGGRNVSYPRAVADDFGVLVPVSH
jgi:hypothetical protein